MRPPRTYDLDVEHFPKWKRVLDLGTMPEASALIRREMLSVARLVNNEVNSKYEYIADRDGDKWLLPDEFEKQGGGDCEDFAIFKMFELYRRGLAPHDMEIGIGIIPGTRICHAVLLVHDDDGSTAMLSCPLLFRAYRFPTGVIRLPSEPFFENYIRFEYFINHEGWRRYDRDAGF